MTSLQTVLQRRHRASGTQAGRRSGGRSIDTSKQVSSSADKARLAAIVESSNDAIISYTQKGIIDSWNQGAERLYGYSAAEAIGKSISMLIPSHQAGEEAKIFQKVRRGEGVDHYETQRLAKDGRLVDIALTVSPIKDAHGALVGVSAVGHDIADRKRAESERGRLVRQLSERVKELTVMYSVAHLAQMEEKSTLTLMEEITSLLPPAWQYPEIAAARVQLGEVEFKTPNFRSSRWSQKAEFTATDGRKGMVEVVYLVERPSAAEGPFLVEERKLINGVAEALKGYWERKRLEAEILEISEREQRRIGQDLHDGLTQHLRGIVYLHHVLHERLVQKSLPEAVDSARITQLLDQAVDQARSLARGLFPVELAATGLMHALRALAVTVKGIYGVPSRFVCPKPVLIHDNPTAIHLYRIAQESVQNAIRHGKATRVVIALSATDDAVTLCVKDNGQGFPQMLPETRGMGLEIMKYRARTIGGQLSHKPDARKGTVLTCVLPAQLGLPKERTS
ncbi:MAG: PAS domain S-box protein [Verrucomicrobia bacterium]|nr:PAS domain S-box protein [Verrucomicrobiota bacterium]